MARLCQVDPPPVLVARVMTRVAEPPPPTLWQWLRRPFRIEVRISPLGAIGLSLGLAVVVALFLASRAHSRAVSLLRVTAEAETGGAQHRFEARGERAVVVRFMLGA